MLAFEEQTSTSESNAIAILHDYVNSDTNDVDYDYIKRFSIKYTYSICLPVCVNIIPGYTKMVY